jgi:hypothetical protein
VLAHLSNHLQFLDPNRGTFIKVDRCATLRLLQLLDVPLERFDLAEQFLNSIFLFLILPQQNLLTADGVLQFHQSGHLMFPQRIVILF